MGNTLEIRSLLNFLALTIFATAAAIFLVGKGNEAVAEMERLNDGPLKMHRVALAEQLGEASPAQPLDTSTWKTYRNEKYGFEVTLSDSWEGFRVIDETPYYDSTVHFLFFEVPTTDKQWKEAGFTRKNDTPIYTGYYRVMIVGIHPVAEWEKIKGGALMSYLGENDKYVFTYAGPQAAPSDWYAGKIHTEEVLSSFRIIK